jgi:hypothetical protein
MRDIIRCDQCGKERPHGDAPGWAQVVPSQVRVIGNPLSVEREFCSVACLISFYMPDAPTQPEQEAPHAG